MNTTTNYMPLENSKALVSTLDQDKNKRASTGNRISASPQPTKNGLSGWLVPVGPTYGRCEAFLNWILHWRDEAACYEHINTTNEFIFTAMNKKRSNQTRRLWKVASLSLPQ